MPPSIAPEEYFSKEKNKAKLKFRVRTDSVIYYAILVGCHSSYMYNICFMGTNHCLLNVFVLVYA